MVRATIRGVLLSTLLAGATLPAGAVGPVVLHDCTLEISTRPRPCDDDMDITRWTSIYFELMVPLLGHYPGNGVDQDSVVLTIAPEGGDPQVVFGPDRVWAPGWSGRALEPAISGSNWVFGFESVPDGPL
ncbi:MAG: hypothetical protein D6738_06790, partial [Acidobacteria bacterium]